MSIKKHYLLALRLVIIASNFHISIIKKARDDIIDVEETSEDVQHLNGGAISYKNDVNR